MVSTKILIIICVIAFTNYWQSNICIADVNVSEYRKSNGTTVSPHWRSSPNKNHNDNWSVRPNINPYTGTRGTKAPSFYENHNSTDSSYEPTSGSGATVEDVYGTPRKDVPYSFDKPPINMKMRDDGWKKFRDKEYRNKFLNERNNR